MKIILYFLFEAALTVITAAGFSELLVVHMGGDPTKVALSAVLGAASIATLLLARILATGRRV